MRCSTPLDRLAVGYLCAFALALIIFGRDDPNLGERVLVNVIVLAAVIGIILRWSHRERGIIGFFRHLYPVMLFPFFYAQTQTAVHWIIPGFLDVQIVAFERALFGVDPNIWLTRWDYSILNEWMMAGYFSYYWLLPLTVIPLYWRGEYEQLRRLLTGCTIAFIISYIGFVVYPVEGPRYYLAAHFDGPLAGSFFVPVVNWIIAKGAIHGGCMPSSHTAVALVVLVWAWRYKRRWALWMAPFVLTLFAATVWGRFHYISDMAVGFVVGMIGIILSERWCSSALPPTQKPVSIKAATNTGT